MEISIFQIHDSHSRKLRAMAGCVPFLICLRANVQLIDFDITGKVHLEFGVVLFVFNTSDLHGGQIQD